MPSEASLLSGSKPSMKEPIASGGNRMEAWMATWLGNVEAAAKAGQPPATPPLPAAVSYTHLRAHETR
eukprot:8096371-Prorocentrum_lima.AAC.1